MERTARRRSVLLSAALALLVLAGGVFMSPLLMQDAYAQQENTCSVNCGSRGSCSATGNCTCTCSTFLGIPSCTCGASQPAPPAGGS